MWPAIDCNMIAARWGLQHKNRKSRRSNERNPSLPRDSRKDASDQSTAYLLTEAWFTVFALGAVNECGSLGVETMQTIRVLVHEGVILRDELPADFRRIDGGLVGHDGAIVPPVISIRMRSFCACTHRAEVRGVN